MGKDYTLDLCRIAAGIVADCLGDTLKASVRYSPDGNSVLMEFDGYPLYGSGGRKGKVFVQFPRSIFCVRRGEIKFEAVQQAKCRYYQETVGHPFAHPHVFSSDGHPCWAGGERNRQPDFITNIEETLSLQNVTRDSVMIGHCASSVMGTGEAAITNAAAYQGEIIRMLNCKSVIRDHRRLEAYVTKLWSYKTTLLMRSA